MNKFLIMFSKSIIKTTRDLIFKIHIIELVIHISYEMIKIMKCKINYDMIKIMYKWVLNIFSSCLLAITH